MDPGSQAKRIEHKRLDSKLLEFLEFAGSSVDILVHGPAFYRPLLKLIVILINAS